MTLHLTESVIKKNLVQEVSHSVLERRPQLAPRLIMKLCVVYWMSTKWITANINHLEQWFMAQADLDSALHKASLCYLAPLTLCDRVKPVLYKHKQECAWLIKSRTSELYCRLLFRKTVQCLSCLHSSYSDSCQNIKQHSVPPNKCWNSVCSSPSPEPIMLDCPPIKLNCDTEGSPEVCAKDTGRNTHTFMLVPQWTELPFY